MAQSFPSPAQTAPTELLDEIFKLSMPSRAEVKILGKISLDDAPWVFGRVCAKWRAIALDMPGLWTSVTIAIPYGLPENIARNFPPGLLREYLSRSGKQKLDVLFTSKEEYPASTTEALFSVLCAASERWEALEFESRQPLPFDQLRGKLPELRRLCLCPSGFDHIIPPSPCPRIRDAGGALLLRDIEIGAFLPWEQLVEYTTANDEYNNVERLRQAADSLVACQFAVDLLWAPQMPPIVTTFTQLRKLTLTIRSTHFTSPPFLDSLELPALEELYINQRSGLGGLVPMLRRSGCSLRRLWLNGPLPRADFVWLAENNPLIEELGLVWFGSTDGIVQKLVVTPGGHTLLPALRALHVQGKDPFFLFIFEVLESRKAHGTPLEVLSMHVPERWYAPMTARLQALKDSGLEVQAMKKIQDPNRLVNFI
ncbi:hypothetical protein B0H11DRAFT_1952778 [Mycena galericulata]|nr:hypothetical protein B0H11DRAFT_1952778 [Mycena galericulata]